MSVLPCDLLDDFVDRLGLFFQYPAQTERAFYHTVIYKYTRNVAYLPVPYATLIDKRYEMTTICSALLRIVSVCNPKPTFTCCQHIKWKHFIPFWKQAGIDTVYVPHKLRGEHMVEGIRIKACPLYAVNIETPTMSIGVREVSPYERDLLYSFVGAFMPHYMSSIRSKLFAIDHPKDAFVRNIGKWHLEDVVYSKNQNASQTVVDDKEREARTMQYNDILSRSKFSLCPSGAGPNSIRFWESLAIGSIPVVLSDGLCLPYEDGKWAWENCVIFVDESDVYTIEARLRSIPLEKVVQMSRMCKCMYERHGLKISPPTEVRV